MHDSIYDRTYREMLSNCSLCPRECGVNRFEGETGYCGADAGMNIASICIHRGEEPAISGPGGICNIFFSGCNLRCVYCQNYDISRPGAGCRNDYSDLSDVLDAVITMLSSGIKAVGFVSPSHVVPQVRAITEGLIARGYNPVTVYNTNGYDKKETIKSLEGLIDIYLPDFKYASPEIAGKYSDASDYPEIVLSALREMYYQMGSVLATDDEGRAERGILIRHLVLPGHVEESKKVLKMIAEELSPGISLSLMSQYHPMPGVKDQFGLDRRLYRSEYESVVKEMENLGFRNGWVQDLDSYRNYRPDFRKDHPFE